MRNAEYPTVHPYSAFRIPHSAFVALGTARSASSTDGRSASVSTMKSGRCSFGAASTPRPRRDFRVGAGELRVIELAVEAHDDEIGPVGGIERQHPQSDRFHLLLQAVLTYHEHPPSRRAARLQVERGRIRRGHN